ncbi:MAG: DUF937 domain-containing protein [Rhodothermales bacterium]|nr:DUF937 domain-containing protein [Rhodothermales bacterium]
MAGILDLVGPALAGDTLGQLSRAIGADERATQRAATAALPVILGALNRNASTPSGAEALARALDRDHDGGLLDHLGGFLGGLAGGERAPAAGRDLPDVSARTTNGAGILGHVFGDRLPRVEEGVARATGLDRGQVLQLLIALAPLVLGALGRVKRERNLDARGLPDVLGTEAARARDAAPSDLLGTVAGFLDRDGDGNPMDDVAGMLGGFLRRR